MRRIILIGLLAALAIALLLSPFASQSPDGLEKVADDKGFLQKGEEKEIFSAPIPDYTLPGVKNEGMATSLAGLIGTLVVFAAASGLGYLLRGGAKEIAE
jgi:cobalt/nickel transport protein